MSGKILKYAVIGDPVSHSLSPLMHNAAFKFLGVPAEYIAMRVKKAGLADFAEDARKKIAGFNITVPHKNAVIPFLDSISPECKLSGSVNTVTNRNGFLCGESTDGYGLEMAIKEKFGIGLVNKSFLFLGAGGTVKAVSFHFAANGAKTLFFANRTVSKSKTLIDEIKAAYPCFKMDYCSLDDEEKIKRFIKFSAVVVQSTSLGLKPDDASPIPRNLFISGVCYYDTIYKNTAFLKLAEERGCKCADGKSMLLYQGAKSFSIWTGRAAPIGIMKKELYKNPQN